MKNTISLTTLVLIPATCCLPCVDKTQPTQRRIIITECQTLSICHKPKSSLAHTLRCIPYPYRTYCTHRCDRKYAIILATKILGELVCTSCESPREPEPSEQLFRQQRHATLAHAPRVNTCDLVSAYATVCTRHFGH